MHNFININSIRDFIFKWLSHENQLIFNKRVKNIFAQNLKTRKTDFQGILEYRVKRLGKSYEVPFLLLKFNPY